MVVVIQGISLFAERHLAVGAADKCVVVTIRTVIDSLVEHPHGLCPFASDAVWQGLVTAMRIFNILGNAEQKTLVQAIGHKEFAAESGTEHTCLQVADDVEERVFD